MRRQTLGLLASLVWLLVGCGGPLGSSATAATPTAVAPVVALGQRAGAVNPDAIIDGLLSKMTLDQKIGQLFMVEFLGTSYNSYIDAMVHGAHAGGVIIYNNDSRTIASMQQLNAAMQAHADFPLLLALDQEGGEVNRLANFYGYAPSAQAMAATGNTQTAYDAGVKAAQELLGLGFNVNLAPVVDVQSTPDPIEGSRLWSTSPTTTAEFAGAFLAGTQSQGVVGSIKHWPGMGAATGDPHSALPTIPHTLDQLNTIDMAPFAALLPRGPGMVMVTHVIVPALDPKRPATLSPVLVTDYLRGKLGYQGVVITDALHMEGIYDYMRANGITDYPRMLTEAAIQAILAGDDILEGAFDPNSAQAMLAAIRAAVQSGRIPLARIEASDRRILRLKLAYGIGTTQLTGAAGG